MGDKIKNLRRKHRKELTSKYLIDSEDNSIKSIIEQLVDEYVNLHLIQEELNSQGIAVRDRYGCTVPNKLLSERKSSMATIKQYHELLFKMTHQKEDGSEDTFVW